LKILQKTFETNTFRIVPIFVPVISSSEDRATSNHVKPWKQNGYSMIQYLEDWRKRHVQKESQKNLEKLKVQHEEEDTQTMHQNAKRSWEM